MKFVGLYAVVNLFSPKGKPRPTLSGLGVTSSSIWRGLPEPNWICKVWLFKNLVINLRFLDLVFNI